MVYSAKSMSDSPLLLFSAPFPFKRELSKASYSGQWRFLNDLKDWTGSFCLFVPCGKAFGWLVGAGLG